MKHYLSQHASGQTMLELIIAVGVIGFVITGLVVAVTSSLKFGQASRTRSAAVKYAQEGVELSRTLRDSTTWNEFLTYTDPAGKKWCLEKNGAWSLFNSATCAAIDNRFTRSVTFTWTDPVAHVDVDVIWEDGGSSFSTKLETALTQWRQ